VEGWQSGPKASATMGRLQAALARRLHGDQSPWLATSSPPSKTHANTLNQHLQRWAAGRRACLRCDQWIARTALLPLDGSVARWQGDTLEGRPFSLNPEPGDSCYSKPANGRDALKAVLAFPSNLHRRHHQPGLTRWSGSPGQRGDLDRAGFVHDQWRFRLHRTADLFRACR